MERLAAFVGVLGLLAAAGALVVGDLILVPGLSAQHLLLDANLATSVTEPVHLRCAEVALVGTIVLALAVPRWLGSRFATAAALLAVGCAGLSRAVLLPKIYTAWGHVDLVAGRPLAQLGQAKELAEQGQALHAVLGVFLLLVVGFVAAQRSARAPRLHTSSEASPPPEATTTESPPSPVAAGVTAA
ncbi:MAG: hypothetical protein JKY37_25460 [Nannocystaceae bacterium]|nr:hypothetical protein [Nannocystaceae bacterium]